MYKINEEQRPVVLVVDDCPEILDIIKTILEDRYVVKLATRGDVAIKIAETVKPDIILLDVVMPGMNGYEVCFALKENPETTHIPVIMVSANSQENDELVGLQAGAVDYISKPISAPILLARVALHIQLMQTSRDLQKAHNKVLAERDFMALLVHQMRTVSHFDDHFIRYGSRSEEINSGDILLAAFRPDGIQHVLVGDFTGHGLPAAIGVPLVTYIFYARTYEGVDLANILEEINVALIEMLPVNIFMSTVAVEINKQRTEGKIWNYGMEPILVLNPEHSWLELTSKSMPLGITKINDIAYHHQLGLNSKTYIYLLTDGMTEAADNSIKQKKFGISRLKSSLINNLKQHTPLMSVLDEVSNYAHSPISFDDMTLVEIRSH